VNPRLTMRLLVGGALLMSPLVAFAQPDADSHASDSHGADLHGADLHGAGQTDESAHGHDAHHAEHAAPTFADINWFYGFIGEKEGVEPGLLFRPPGTPVPLGALLLNTAILFYLLGRFGGPAIRSGLSSRKQRIAGDIEAARRMQEEAKGQLDHYEQKLAHMSAETERILAEVRAQAKLEHERIVLDAKARHLALEEEARQIIEHERAHARQAAIETMVARAVDGARAEIVKSLRPDDQERLARALTDKIEGPAGASFVGQSGVVGPGGNAQGVES
jgi:F-type H+-transporting ATPase subunit b